MAVKLSFQYSNIQFSRTHGQKPASFDMSFNLFQQLDQQRSHGLRQLVDSKSVTSCQQTCCKLIVKICYSQAYCKLFQQVVTSLQMTSCNRLTLPSLVQVDEIYKLQQAVKLTTNCIKSSKPSQVPLRPRYFID